MTCPHWELTCNGFDHYQYCIRCKVRVHVVMTGQFSYNRFVECKERLKYPKQLFGGEKPCKCRETFVPEKEGEFRLS